MVHWERCQVCQKFLETEQEQEGRSYASGINPKQYELIMQYIYEGLGVPK